MDDLVDDVAVGAVIPATQPLRDEHRALLPELGALRSAGDAVGTPGGGHALERAYRLLERHLLPHMVAEEAALYPTVDRLTRADATASMRFTHGEIRRRIIELGALRTSDTDDPDVQRDLRAALYGLDAIVRLHLVEEEELLYPVLDAHLSGPEAAAIVGALHQVERGLYQEPPTAG